MIRRGGGLMLVLADPGGDPLERLLGRPMTVTEFLRLAVPLASLKSGSEATFNETVRCCAMLRQDQFFQFIQSFH